MNRNKMIFFVFAVIFFVLMIFIGVDISSRTTFPGSKSQLKERIKSKIQHRDSNSLELKDDSILFDGNKNHSNAE